MVGRACRLSMVAQGQIRSMSTITVGCAANQKLASAHVLPHPTCVLWHHTLLT
jgi:hypothetical protein